MMMTMMMTLLLRHKTSQTHKIDLIEMLISYEIRQRNFAADFHKQQRQTKKRRAGG